MICVCQVYNCVFLGRRTACRTAPCAPTATFDSRGRAAWPRSLRTAARRVDRSTRDIVECSTLQSWLTKGHDTRWDPDMKTYSARPRDVTRAWFVVDATDKVLGRLATEIAARLRGKHKPIYTPHIDTGDFIVVTNVEKIRVTGTKVDTKLYHRHSGYPGGITTTTFGQMQARFPGRALEKAVKGMLPKGPLGYAMIKKLKCYAGPAHPHSAQQPKALEIGSPS